MDEVLSHHGIKGMKWGVRRTPEQLGHKTGSKASSGEKGKTIAKKTPSSVTRNKNTLSDEELQRRINRLNMEERYDDLVARKKIRDSSGFKATAKKLLGNAAEDLGRQLLSKAVSKLVDRIAGDKSNKFDIDDYKNMDVNDMDAETIAKVSKWYSDALKIDSSRSKLSPTSGGNDAKPSSQNDTGSGNQPSSSSGTTQKQLDDWVRQRNRAMKDLKWH